MVRNKLKGKKKRTDNLISRAYVFDNKASIDPRRLGFGELPGWGTQEGAEGGGDSWNGLVNVTLHSPILPSASPPSGCS